MTRHLDLLTTYQSKGFYGIILDDKSFNSSEYTMSIESQIHLLDREDDTQVHCRYKVAQIPAHTPLIITSNKHPTQVVALHDPAVERRVTCMLMVSPHEFQLYEYSATATAHSYVRPLRSVPVVDCDENSFLNLE